MHQVLSTLDDRLDAVIAHDPLDSSSECAHMHAVGFDASVDFGGLCIVTWPLLPVV